MMSIISQMSVEQSENPRSIGLLDYWIFQEVILSFHQIHLHSLLVVF